MKTYSEFFNENGKKHLSSFFSKLKLGKKGVAKLKAVYLDLKKKPDAKGKTNDFLMGKAAAKMGLSNKDGVEILTPLFEDSAPSTTTSGMAIVNKPLGLKKKMEMMKHEKERKLKEAMNGKTKK